MIEARNASKAINRLGHSYLIGAYKCRTLERVFKKPINELVEDWLQSALRIEHDEAVKGDPERAARAAIREAKRAAQPKLTPAQILAKWDKADRRKEARRQAKQRQG